MKLLRIALPVPLYREFDYTADNATDDDAGRLVRVRLGPRRLLGVVVSNPNRTDVPPASLLPIDGFAGELPRVPDDVLALARFAADYYQFPLGMTLQHAVPPRGRREPAQAARPPDAYRITERGVGALGSLPARAPLQRALAAEFSGGDARSRESLLSAWPSAAPLLRRWQNDGWICAVAPAETPGHDGHATLPVLSGPQQVAVEAILGAGDRFQPFLLRGITGSGKTEVYLACAAQRIARGGQVLMLVPEINLTPQLGDRIRRALPGIRIAMLHSHLPDAQRLAAWRQAASGSAQLVLGTRLAAFAPMPRLALVVVDEENDLSYKQQDGLRYSARDLAVYRARLRNVPVVLGSATPSMETLWQARRGRYQLLALDERAGGGKPPAIRLIPQRGQHSSGGLTPPLVEEIGKRLARNEQSLIFINRRGYSPSLLCVECAWAANCVRCSARLVVHLAQKCLRCHHCGHQEPLASTCPACGNQDLLPLGFGTQRLESALREAFPSARIARIDADSTRRRGSWPELLKAILAGELDIMIGTQMLVKGHDFPLLTLVGILGADNALYSADFRATERLYAQLTQVAGRAGRSNLPGEVLVQTDFPNHPLYRALVTNDDHAHIEALFAERRQLGLPPYSRLALLRAESRDRTDAEGFLDAANEQGTRLAGPGSSLRVCAPVPARMARRAGFERAHILVQSAAAAPLQDFLSRWRAWIVENAPRNVRWSIDVDPQDIE